VASRYFAEQQNHGANEATLGAAKAKLNQMFDELIPGLSPPAAMSSAILPVSFEHKLTCLADDEKQHDATGKVLNNELDPQGCMEYIQRLGVNMASYEQFVPLEIVQSETLGIITRRGFVDGWARALAEASQGKAAAPQCDWSTQKKLVRARINKTLTDPAAYKVYYDYAFQLGKEPTQKALNMALAVGLWEGLYEPNTHPWRSANVDWLGAWTTYLKDKFGVVKINDDGEEEIEYKRTVSRDLWNQTRLFAAKTMEDETLGFWSEEQAWPGLIDEFVVWCREKGIVPAAAAAQNGGGAGGGDSMEYE
jgi:DCN1-like protein 1/2